MFLSNSRYKWCLNSTISCHNSAMSQYIPIVQYVTIVQCVVAIVQCDVTIVCVVAIVQCDVIIVRVVSIVQCDVTIVQYHNSTMWCGHNSTMWCHNSKIWCCNSTICHNSTMWCDVTIVECDVTIAQCDVTIAVASWHKTKHQHSAANMSFTTFSKQRIITSYTIQNYQLFKSPKHCFTRQCKVNRNSPQLYI